MQISGSTWQQRACLDFGVVDMHVGALVNQVVHNSNGGRLAGRREGRMPARCAHRVSPVFFLKAKPKSAIFLPVTVSNMVRTMLLAAV